MIDTKEPPKPTPALEKLFQNRFPVNEKLLLRQMEEDTRVRGDDWDRVFWEAIRTGTPVKVKSRFWIDLKYFFLFYIYMFLRYVRSKFKK